MLQVSLDGGLTYQAAPEGVRVIYDEQEIPGEDETGELHLNCTYEGLIMDIWVGVEESDSVATSSETTETTEEIINRLCKK